MIAISSPTRRAMQKTGSYTGNDVNNRDIDIGVELNAKNNVYVIVQCTSNYSGLHRVEIGQGDLTNMFHTSGSIANKIQGLTSTGFQIGDDVDVNANGLTYQYVVTWEEP